MLQYSKTEMDYISNKSEVMAELVKHFGHMDRGLVTDVFESLVVHIIGQMLSNVAAASIVGKVIDSIGIITPDSIIVFGVENLQRCGVAKRKAQYIWELADSVKKGIYCFDGLNDLNDEQVIAYLTQIKGVGRWTAEMIAEFTMGRLNIFSYDDVALQNGIKKAHGFKTLSRIRFERMRKLYSPYCSVASLYYYALNDEK